MMKLGEGRDATALFEAHHAFTNRVYLEKLLLKYEVDPSKVECQLYDERDNEQYFDWPEFESKGDGVAEMAPVTPFAHELRTKVRAYFEGEAKRRGVPLLEAMKATPERWLEIAGLVAVLCSLLPAFLRGELWACFAAPIAYWIVGVNTFHDGSHHAMSRDWRVNAIATYVGFYFSSPLEWYHQHVIGHHAYPNIPKRDPDLYHNSTMERHTKTLRHKPLHEHQHKTFYPIWVIGTTAMCYLKPLQTASTGYYNRAVAVVQHAQWRWMLHWAGRAGWFFLLHVLPYFVYDSAVTASCVAWIPIFVVSVCFMISSQVNHLSSANIDKSSRDYYAHQVVTGHSFIGNSAIERYLTFLFTGGLSLQIEHHIFPCINHCHLPKIQPIIKAVCKKHNVPYHESSGLPEALSKYVAHMKELSVAEIAEEVGNHILYGDDHH